MNKLPYLKTTFSCAGHPSQHNYSFFWTRGAWVSFVIENEKKWKKVLYNFIKQTKDCRYNVSIEKIFEIYNNKLNSSYILLILPISYSLKTVINKQEECRKHFDEAIKIATDFFNEQAIAQRVKS